MKTILTLFVLLFSSLVFADDISDFQIEGISIGDSLLDYFSEEEIKKNIAEYYPNYQDQSFTTTEFYKHSLFKKYESVQFNFKRSDKNYLIYAITGANFYEDNINNCFLELDKIEKELSILFNNTKKINLDKRSHHMDLTGQSYTLGFGYLLESNDAAIVECYDWTKKLTKEKGWTDKLSVTIWNSEFSDWLHQN